MRPQDEEGLAQPEGVNAASDQVEQEALHPPHPRPDDGRSGGRPDAAEQADHAAAPHDELLGPPGQDGDEPGQETSVGEG
jgi:hypothetical protein